MRSRWTTPDETAKALTRFREFVAAAVGRLDPKQGEAMYFESSNGQSATLTWGLHRNTAVDAMVAFEGSNGWRVILGRSSGYGIARRMKWPKLDGLNVDTFCMALNEMILGVRKLAKEEQARRDQHQEQMDAFNALKVRAVNALGTPLAVEIGYSQRIGFTPVAIGDDFVLNVEVRWNKLTVEQAKALVKLLDPGEEHKA